MSNKNIYLKLNNYDYSKNNLTEVKDYIKNNTIPDNLTQPQKRIFINRYTNELFNVKDNN